MSRKFWLLHMCRQFNMSPGAELKKTKICLMILSAIIVLSCPVYGQRSSVVGPNSTVVVPSTKLQTNYRRKSNVYLCLPIVAG
jgi:hypothetical protein